MDDFGFRLPSWQLVGLRVIAMLSRLLALIKSSQGVISEEALCEALAVSPEMLEGLLSRLVQMERLVEMNENKPESCSKCEECAIEQHCDLVSLYQERRFEVVESV